MLHPEYPVVSFLSVFLLLCSAPSHIRARNIATVSLHLWLAVLSVIRGINSIAWADNVEKKLLVWCDITTKIDIGFTIAVPASALCLMVHLEHIASARSARITAIDKHRRQIFEFAMCFAVPIIFMALHYIVQGHRFDIYQDQGCLPAIYVSIPAIFILWVPPLIFACISFIFAALSLRHILRHRVSFSNHLNSGSAISTHRYFRLMLFAIIEMVWDLGTNIWILCLNISLGLHPWSSWGYVHSNFSRVDSIPYILLPQSVISADIFVWWILPVSCFLVFAIFGTGREAMADYRAAFNWFKRKILRREIAINMNPALLSSMSQSLPTTRHNIHVSIPPPSSVSISDTNDSPKKPSSFQNSHRRSLSRSSISTKTRSEGNCTFPPAIAVPGVGVETLDSPADASNVIQPLSHTARLSSGSEIEKPLPEPFSHPKQFSWRSDHVTSPSVFPGDQRNSMDSDLRCNDYIHKDTDISPV